MLREALSDDGDLELRFQCGQSLPVHGLKLKLASPVLKGLISAVLDDLIATAAAKRRRMEDGGSSVADQQELPSLHVSHSSIRLSEKSHSHTVIRRRQSPIAHVTPHMHHAANPG